MVQECSINHAQVDDNDHNCLVIFASMMATNNSSEFQVVETPMYHACEQYLNTLPHTEHSITRPLAHPRPPTLGTHKEAETSYSMAQFLNNSREDPWTAQYPRFQDLHGVEQPQESYSLIHFLEGNSDDPWTSERHSITSARVAESDLREVDRLFSTSPSGMSKIMDNGGRIPS